VYYRDIVLISNVKLKLYTSTGKLMSARCESLKTAVNKMFQRLDFRLTSIRDTIGYSEFILCSATIFNHEFI
jgi:hypothetical protein